MSLANQTRRESGQPVGHEDFGRHVDIKGSSDRSFGFVMAAVFVLVGLIPLTRGMGPRIWALVVAAVFLVVTLGRPGLLHLLNVGWGRIGVALAKVTTPVLMGLIFYLIVTPLGILFRLLGRDPMRLRSTGQSSYWVRRLPPGPLPETMKDQF
ncbi:MAG: SxtJ family membrane protein [Bryobacteraceae bacterium]